MNKGGCSVDDYDSESYKPKIRCEGKPKVAFVCVHNSCRSQIAEALGKKLASDVFESYSAGTELKDYINPDAVRIMKMLHGIDACRMRLDNLMVQKQTDNKKNTSVCLLAELEREIQRVEDSTIQLYKEYASGGYSKEEYLSLRKSNQSLLGELEEKIAGIAEQESEPEPEESEDDLKQCSMLEEYDGNVLSKLIEKVYIYGDGNLQVVFKNDDYFRKVCKEEGDRPSIFHDTKY